MNHGIRIFLASLMALSAQYIADIAGFMVTALFAHGVSDYLKSFIVAITNIVIVAILFRCCALRWFRLKPSMAELTINIHGMVLALLLCLSLFAAIFLISLFWVDEYIVANFERIGLILFNSFINRGISTAIGEELLFRGFLFSYLLSITKPINAFVISIMVFVLPHMLVFQPDLTALFILINYISVSLLLTALYYKTKSISTSIVFHALYNFILYGIWNVGSTGESDSSIFTSIMSNTESDGIILFSAVCLILMSCFIFKSNKNWQVCAAIELTD